MKHSLFILILFISALLVNLVLSEDDENKTKYKKYYDIKVKFTKGMIINKKMEVTKNSERKDENGKKISETIKNARLIKLTILECKNDKPTKIKYDFIENTVTGDVDKDEKYIDKAKGHWIKVEIDKKNKVEIIDKSEDFPDSLYILSYIKETYLLDFIYIDSMLGDIGSTWENSVYFSASFGDWEDLRMQRICKFELSNVVKTDDCDIAQIDFTLDDPMKEDCHIFIKGSIYINLTKYLIKNWNAKVTFKIGENDSTFSFSVTNTYGEKKEEEDKKDTKKEKIEPKTEDDE